MSQQPDGAAVVPVSDEASGKPMDVVDVEQGTGSGGVSTECDQRAPNGLSAFDSCAWSPAFLGSTSTRTISGRYAAALRILWSRMRPISGPGD